MPDVRLIVRFRQDKFKNRRRPVAQVPQSIPRYIGWGLPNHAEDNMNFAPREKRADPVNN